MHPRPDHHFPVARGGSPEPESMAGYFADVSKDSYYFKATQWANEQDMTTGIGFVRTIPAPARMRWNFMWKMDGKPGIGPRPPLSADVPDY